MKGKKKKKKSKGPPEQNIRTQNSLLSPISQTSKTPSSGMLFRRNAFLSSCGGSRTSSTVRTQVPQWMPMARAHWVSLNMLTLLLFLEREREGWGLVLWDVVIV